MSLIWYVSKLTTSNAPTKQCISWLEKLSRKCPYLSKISTCCEMFKFAIFQVRDLWKWDELKYSLNVTAIAYLLLAYIVSSYQICYAFKLESPILSILPRIQIHRWNANTCNGFKLSMDGFPITV